MTPSYKASWCRSGYYISPTILLTEFKRHACGCDIKHSVVFKKASVWTILNIKPRDHVTSYFNDLEIFSIKMISEYCTLKLVLKTFSEKFLLTLLTK